MLIIKLNKIQVSLNTFNWLKFILVLSDLYNQLFSISKNISNSLTLQSLHLSKAANIAMVKPFTKQKKH
jgi:hypothetical protein